MLDPFHLQGPQQAFESINQSIHSQDHPKRTSADTELRNHPTKTLTFIFITTKKKQLFSSMKKQLWHAVI